MQGNPTVTSTIPGSLDVFLGNSAGYLSHYYYGDPNYGTGWDTWGYPTNGLVGDPSVTSLGDRRLLVLAQSSSGLQYDFYDDWQNFYNFEPNNIYSPVQNAFAVVPTPWYWQ